MLICLLWKQSNHHLSLGSSFIIQEGLTVVIWRVGNLMLLHVNSLTWNYCPWCDFTNKLVHFYLFARDFRDHGELYMCFVILPALFQPSWLSGFSSCPHPCVFWFHAISLPVRHAVNFLLVVGGGERYSSHISRWISLGFCFPQCCTIELPQWGPTFLGSGPDELCRVGLWALFDAWDWPVGLIQQMALVLCTELGLPLQSQSWPHAYWIQPWPHLQWMRPAAPALCAGLTQCTGLHHLAMWFEKWWQGAMAVSHPHCQFKDPWGVL